MLPQKYATDTLSTKHRKVCANELLQCFPIFPIIRIALNQGPKSSPFSTRSYLLEHVFGGEEDYDRRSLCNLLETQVSRGELQVKLGACVVHRDCLVTSKKIASVLIICCILRFCPTLISMSLTSCSKKLFRYDMTDRLIVQKFAYGLENKIHISSKTLCYSTAWYISIRHIYALSKFCFPLTENICFLSYMSHMFLQSCNQMCSQFHAVPECTHGSFFSCLTSTSSYPTYLQDVFGIFDFD